MKWCFVEVNYFHFHDNLGLAAPKGLFPPEPEMYRGPKLKVAIIGAGLAGMSTAVELLDQGHEVRFLLVYNCPLFMLIYLLNHCKVILVYFSFHLLILFYERFISHYR